MSDDAISAGSMSDSSSLRSVFAELTPPYSTIVADPPWHYDARPVGGATPGTMGQAQPFPYSTMSVDEVCALPVGDLAGADAVLWLWTTNRYLPDSFRVLAAWGFTYRQTLVWGKNNPMPVGSVAHAHPSESYERGWLRHRRAG